MATGWPMKTTYANGDVYAASDVNDITGTVNLLQTSTLSAQAGKNGVINGGMDIWQRGTSSTTTSNDYVADRWQKYVAGISGRTYSRQSSGLTGIQYGMRIARDNLNSSTSGLSLFYNFESADSYRFAGKAVTISFYAKAGANYSSASSALGVQLAYGTGTDQNLISGYTGQTNTVLSTATLTTTYQRFTFTGTINAAATQLGIQFYWTPVGVAGANDWCEITGVMVELGSYATTFSRAGGTIQGELASCQRYYTRITGSAAYSVYGFGYCASATSSTVHINLPVTMRIAPTALEYSNLAFQAGSSSGTVSASGTLVLETAATGVQLGTVSSTTTTNGTANYATRLLNNNNTAGYIGFSAEL